MPSRASARHDRPDERGRGQDLGPPPGPVARPAAYSCLAVLPDGAAACLFEAGDQHAYERIVLARISLDGGPALKMDLGNRQSIRCLHSLCFLIEWGHG